MYMCIYKYMLVVIINTGSASLARLRFLFCFVLFLQEANSSFI